MEIQEVILGASSCYENEAGDRWYTSVLYPNFDEPGFSGCDTDPGYFSFEMCE